MKKIILAIDGFSSTGKSTVAKQLAKELGYVYVDTGSMYRAVTLYAMQNKLISEHHFDEENLIQQLANIDLNFQFNAKKGFAEVYLNGTNVEANIRSLEVSQFVSTIAAVPEVRKKQVEQQHAMGKKKGIVMDGRDIGTVVFPEAELKIFMTASAKTRAERRYKELIEKGEDVTYHAVLENIEARDTLDTSREDSPLTKAKDAIIIDNSNLNLEQQFHKILALAEDKIQA